MSNSASDRPVASNGMLWVALGASLWGTDSMFRVPLTGQLSSGEIVFFEHLILTVALFPLLYFARRQWSALSARQWVAVVCIGWGGSALGTLFFTQAVKLGNPTGVILLQKLQPLIAVLLARLYLREQQPLRRAFWLRMGIALFAAMLIGFGGSGAWPSLQGVQSQSAGLAIAAAAIWGSCTVLGRYVAPSLSPLTLTALRVTTAAPLLALLVAARRPDASLPLPATAQIPALLFIALIPGLAALSIYYHGLRSTPASLATIAELCFPASAGLLNWMFLDARLSWPQLIGVALLTAVILRGDSTKGPQTARSGEPESASGPTAPHRIQEN